jgi:hypothetical protein
VLGSPCIISEGRPSTFCSFSECKCSKTASRVLSHKDLRYPLPAGVRGLRCRPPVTRLMSGQVIMQ